MKKKKKKLAMLIAVRRITSAPQRIPHKMITLLPSLLTLARNSYNKRLSLGKVDAF